MAAEATHDGTTPPLEQSTAPATAGRVPALVLFFAIVLPVFALFFFTAQRTLPYHIDPFSNTAPAWSIATRGSIYLDDYSGLTGPDYFRSVGWFVEVDGRVVSQYPPGAALWGALFYAVGPSEAELVVGTPANTRGLDSVEVLVPALGTAAAAAAAAVAIAVGFLALTFRTLTDTRTAVVAALLVGFGTSAWNVASSQLWQHGPAMMWLAIGGFLVASARPASAGLAYGFAILTRPPTAIMAAATGIGTAWEGRSWRRLAAVALGSVAGLAAVVAFNAVVFGEPSISGGYTSTFTDNVISSNPGRFVGNVLGGLLDPGRGLLVWSPFLVVLVPGMRAGWRAAPGWIRGGAIGAVSYLLVHWRANRFSGGDGFYGYRYPLEAIVAAAPFLLVTYREWVAQRRWASRLFAIGGVAAVTLQAVVALR